MENGKEKKRVTGTILKRKWHCGYKADHPHSFCGNLEKPRGTFGKKENTTQKKYLRL